VPLAYHYRPEELAVLPAFTCPTLYVVGGMYGNPYARRGAGPGEHRARPTGDRLQRRFPLSRRRPRRLRTVDDGVRAHHAIQGNIEYALGTADDTLGCGCDYPD
jgi:hypothetical protein